MAADFTIHVGDNRETLKAIPDASVHCCVTSPPYWGLRRYGDGSQRDVEHGAEGTLDEHIAVLVDVFREVRRVLHPSGTVWLNYGDAYAGSQQSGGVGSISNNATKQPHNDFKRNTGLKPKDLIGLPWRVAFALQADGWWLRSDIVWHKPAPMPESVTDRPTRSHEYMFLLAKESRYFYDAEAVKEKSGNNTHARGTKLSPPKEIAAVASGNGKDGWTRTTPDVLPTRNLRDVWTIAAEPTKYAHFAAFPRKLVEPCVKAGTSEKGCCPKCFAPWERVVEKPKPPASVFTKTSLPCDGYVFTQTKDGEKVGMGQKLQDWLNANPARTVGWQPTCECDAGDPIPCTVLDPYCGTGRTGAVAVAHGRRFVGLELYENYADYARQYIANPDPMPAEAQVEGQLDLFD